MSSKTNKSFTKRIKITGTGKLKARKPGKGHFNAKQRSVKKLVGKTDVTFDMKPKDKARFLPHN